MNVEICHQTDSGHEKQRSSQRKCIEHLGNLPSHHDNEAHQGIFISQLCYEDKCMECDALMQHQNLPFLLCTSHAFMLHFILAVLKTENVILLRKRLDVK